MQILMINDNKLEVIINMEDIKRNNSNWNNFMSSSVEFQNILLEVLNNIHKNKVFNLKNCKLTVDTYAIPNKKQFILIITKIPSLVTLHKRLKNNTYYLAKFGDFNTLCQFCFSINVKTISKLYYYKNFYYLYIRIIHLRDFKKTILNLKEFADVIITKQYTGKEKELIIKDNAIEICKKFV